jgi:hypothetical protein
VKQIRQRLTYANVMSSIAVFFILGGATAFAATKIGANEIKANSIKTGKIVKEAVTEGKLKSGAVTTNKLGAAAVTGEKLADNAVTTGKIADNAVTTGKIADSAVTTAKVANGAVTNEKIANGAISANKLSTQFLPASTVGVPVAGASIASDGTVNKFFNQAGGAPTVEKQGTGAYKVIFPGLEGQLYFNNSIVLLSLRNGPGEIGRTSFSGNAGINTYNSAGTATDKEFNMVLFVPGTEP